MSLGHRSSKGFEKAGYPSLAAAQARANQRNQNRTVDLRVPYRCPECLAFHVGRREELTDFERRIIEVVRVHRESNQNGPTFREVWLALGNEPFVSKWNKPQPPAFKALVGQIMSLSKRGWLFRTNEARSLNITMRSSRIELAFQKAES